MSTFVSADKKNIFFLTYFMRFLGFSFQLYPGAARTAPRAAPRTPARGLYSMCARAPEL